MKLASLLLLLFAGEIASFSSPVVRYHVKAHSTATRLHMSDGASGGIERLEFKIHADGRIEETVKGIRGDNCQKITEDINAELGEVVSSRPTEEMYEQELRIGNTVELKDENEGGWSNGSW